MLQNKWNGKLYELVEEKEKTVVLKRCSDGAVFEIAKSEYTFSYRLLKKEAVEK